MGHGHGVFCNKQPAMINDKEKTSQAKIGEEV
jgi:hypothetical protein